MLLIYLYYILLIIAYISMHINIDDDEKMDKV